MVDLRVDKTLKGPGFLGTLQRPDGDTSTELSIGVGIGGKETLIPLLVPTLTQDEINYLLEDSKPTKEIIDKAVAHAMQRKSEGKSIFAEETTMATDRFGGEVQQASPSTDRFGGTVVSAEAGAEAVGPGGTQYTSEQLQEYGTISAPPPAGQRFLEDYARPTAQMVGAGGGAVLGGGITAPTGPGALAGAVAGGGIGFAIGDEVVDLIEDWMGYRDPKPLALELKESAEDVRTGLTYELAGHSLLPAAKSLKRPAAWVAGKFTKKGAEAVAGDIIAAMTDKGPLIAKNWEEAKALEAAMPGLKFDLGQLTGEPGIIKFAQAGAETSADIAARQAEGRVANTKAIQDFLEQSREAGAGTRDIKKPLAAQKVSLEKAEGLAQESLEQQTSGLQGTAEPMEAGSIIRKELEAGERAARDTASEIFAEVPEQNLIADDLLDKIRKINKPSYGGEGPRKFPGVIKRNIKFLEDSTKAKGKAKSKAPRGITNDAYDIAQSGKYTSAQAQAKSDAFKSKAAKLTEKEKFEEAMVAASESQKWREVAESMEGAQQHKGRGLPKADDDLIEPKMTLKDLQGFRSEVLEDLRTAKKKGLPASYRNRLKKALDAIDEKLSYGTAKGTIKKAKSGDLIYHSSKEKFKSGKPDKGAKGYFFGDETFSKEFADQWGPNRYAIKLPKGSKIKNLKPETDKESLDIMIEAAKEAGPGVSQPPTDPKLLKEWMTDDMAGSSWIDKEILSKVLKKRGYDGAKWEEEFFIPKELINKSQAYDPKTLKPIGKEVTGGEKLKAAQKFFRENVVEKYHKGATKGIMRGEESVQDAMVSGKFFKTGAKGQQAASEFLNALGDNEEGIRAISNHIDDSLYNIRSDKTGELTQAALNRWLKNHRPALKEYGLENRYDSLVKARAALDEARVNSKAFEKSAASRVLNADVNEVVKKAFSGTGSKKEAAKELMDHFRKPKPSRDELLYHATDKTVPQGQLKGGYFGGKYHLENEMLEPYGDNLHAIKPPKGTKILDLWDGSKDSRDFMKEIFDENPLSAKEYKEAAEIFGYGGPYETLENAIKHGTSDEAADAFVTWSMNTSNIPQKLKLAKEKGYDIINYQGEFLVPESLIKKSQAFDAKTHKPITGKNKPTKTADMYEVKGKFGDEVIPEPKGTYKDPKAMAGLQNAMIDEILTEVPLESPKKMRELLTSTKMAEQFRKYDAAIIEIFKDAPEKVKAMHQVRRAVKTTEYKMGLPGGASGKPKAVLERLAGNYGHAKSTARSIAADMVNYLGKKIGMKDVNKYINRAILDPELATAFMHMAKGGKPEKVGIPFVNRLIATGLITVNKENE